MSRSSRGAAAAVVLALAACSGPSPADLEAARSRPLEPARDVAVIAEPATAWWRTAVFYEIFVRSFADAGDGRLAGDGIGDLRGLVERLDYLNDGDPETADDLGIDGIWLMPVAESPSYHGYDVVDYRSIERDYGTREDFRRLMEAAHERGIRVIVDLVINHTSSRHPWFRAAVRRDPAFRGWYIFSTEPRGYLGPWGQPVWHQLPWWRRGLRNLNYFAYYGIFSPAMPDLDHRNPEVAAEMRSIARFWLEEMGVDGFRLDAARHLVEDGPVQEDTPATHRWLRDFHAEVKRIDPAALVVGEVWDDTETVASYGPDELDLAFQFELAGAVLEAARYGGAAPLAAAYREAAASMPGGRYASFLANHDQVRVMSRLDGSWPAASLAASLLLTSPGTPFLYYGEEIGMHGMKPDPKLRTPMQWSAEEHAGFTSGRPWEPVKPDYERVNVATQSADAGSLLALYRRLIRLRRTHPALATGSFELLDAEPETIFAFAREGAGERLLVVANLGGEEVAELRVSAGPGARECEAADLLHGHPTTGAREPDGVCLPIPPLKPRTLYVTRSAPDSPSP